MDRDQISRIRTRILNEIDGPSIPWNLDPRRYPEGVRKKNVSTNEHEYDIEVGGGGIGRHYSFKRRESK